jgi:hypothetical protein
VFGLGDLVDGMSDDVDGSDPIDGVAPVDNVSKVISVISVNKVIMLFLSSSVHNSPLNAWCSSDFFNASSAASLRV